MKISRLRAKARIAVVGWLFSFSPKKVTFYREIITRVLNSSFEGIMVGQEMYQTPFYLRPDGTLDMDKLLREFQKFYRKNSEHFGPKQRLLGVV